MLKKILPTLIKSNSIILLQNLTNIPDFTSEPTQEYLEEAEKFILGILPSTSKEELKESLIKSFERYSKTHTKGQFIILATSTTLLLLNKNQLQHAIDNSISHKNSFKSHLSDLKKFDKNIYHLFSFIDITGTDNIKSAYMSYSTKHDFFYNVTKHSISQKLNRSIFSIFPGITIINPKYNTILKQLTPISSLPPKDNSSIFLTSNSASKIVPKYFDSKRTISTLSATNNVFSEVSILCTIIGYKTKKGSLSPRTNFNAMAEWFQDKSNFQKVADAFNLSQKVELKYNNKPETIIFSFHNSNYSNKTLITTLTISHKGSSLSLELLIPIQLLNKFHITLKNSSFFQVIQESLPLWFKYKELIEASSDLKTTFKATKISKNLSGKELLLEITNYLNTYLIQQVSFAKVDKVFVLSKYHTQFPAFNTKRKLTFYAGPTNSGKTYQSLKELQSHLTDSRKKAIYLAPLRLMALEKYEDFNNIGLNASLVTGEERRISPHSSVICSTIEMLSTDEVYDAAIIDEVQLIQDSERGWAWYRALCGINSKNIYITGSSSSIPLIQWICKHIDVELEIIKCERRSELKVLPPSKEVFFTPSEPGTAYIAFSQKEVWAIAKKLHDKKLKFAVIYGAMSPELRRRQAELFRSGKVNILIATDAIGMGLNLPINTIIFTSFSKFNGYRIAPITHSEFLQIAGRAGRDRKDGFVGKSNIGLYYLESFNMNEALSKPLESNKALVKVVPTLSQFEALSESLSLPSLIDVISHIKNRGTYDYLDINDLSEMKAKLSYLPQTSYTWPIIEQYHWATIPVNLNNELQKETFQEWIKLFTESKDKQVEIKLSFKKLPKKITILDDLQILETQLNLIGQYNWMSQLYPDIFNQDYSAKKEELFDAMNQVVCITSKRCSSCSSCITISSPHSKCDKCYRRRVYYDYDDYGYYDYDDDF